MLIFHLNYSCISALLLQTLKLILNSWYQPGPDNNRIICIATTSWSPVFMICFLVALYFPPSWPSLWRWILEVWNIPSPISTGRLLSCISLHSQNQDELTWRQAETLFQVYCIKNPLELFYSSATFLGQLSSRFVMSIALPIPRRYSGGQQDL